MIMGGQAGPARRRCALPGRAARCGTLVRVATAKAERLLNLVIALLNTRQFRTAQWIHEKVAGYGDAPSTDAFNRMFERDKQELREMGIPLLTDDRDGYRIPQVEFSLPELNFTPAETAALGLAARLWSTTTLESAGAGAVRKIRDAAGRTATTSAAASAHRRPGVPAAVVGGPGPSRGAVRLPQGGRAGRRNPTPAPLGPGVLPR